MEKWHELVKIKHLVVQIGISIIYFLVKFRFLDGKNNQSGQPTDHFVCKTKSIDPLNLYFFNNFSENGHKLTSYILHNARCSYMCSFPNS